MAIQLKLDYSKKLGLPQYSSHQFSVSLTSEVNDVARIPAEVEVGAAEEMARLGGPFPKKKRE